MRQVVEERTGGSTRHPAEKAAAVMQEIHLTAAGRARCADRAAAHACRVRSLSIRLQLTRTQSTHLPRARVRARQATDSHTQHAPLVTASAIVWECMLFSNCEMRFENLSVVLNTKHLRRVARREIQSFDNPARDGPTTTNKRQSGIRFGRFNRWLCSRTGCDGVGGRRHAVQSVQAEGCWPRRPLCAVSEVESSW